MLYEQLPAPSFTELPAVDADGAPINLTQFTPALEPAQPHNINSIHLFAPTVRHPIRQSPPARSTAPVSQELALSNAADA